MNKTRKYVENLSTKERLDIIKSHEKFEEQGFISDEPIRIYTENLMKLLGGNEYNITFWMNELAMECYRSFAISYIDSIKR
jgi:hypothetical protein